MEEKKIMNASEMGKKGGKARMGLLKTAKARREFGRRAVRAFWKTLDAEMEKNGKRMRVHKAAQFLGMSVGNLRYLTVNHKIPFTTILVGKRECRVYDQEDLVKYKKAHPRR